MWLAGGRCGKWVESVSVVIRRWVWLVGGVVRRYIDFLIVLIPTPLVITLFCSSIHTSSFIFKYVFSFFNYMDYTKLVKYS